MGFLFLGIFVLLLLLYRLPLEAVVYPIALCLATALALAIGDYQRLKKQHAAISRLQSITEVLDTPFPEPHTICEEDYQELLLRVSREHMTYVTQANSEYTDMMDYYTVWVHQIKTPIASMLLTLQNEDTPLSRRLSADLNRVEQYVEMVLAFLRINSESTDYVIREQPIDPIVRSAIKKFPHDFIDRKLRLCYRPMDNRAITDEKWLSFVVEQVLSNALKYTQTGSISIWMDEGNRLHIRDTGIGIAPEDLARIFEKGYTGFNGRIDKRASGLGLYLCKRVCSNLGHGIWAESVVGKGTTVTIDLTQKKLLPE